MLSGTNNFNETSALGLGVTHSLLYGPVPVRLPDLSQQTAPALPLSSVLIKPTHPHGYWGLS